MQVRQRRDTAREGRKTKKRASVSAITAGEDEGIDVVASVALGVASTSVMGNGLGLLHPLEERLLLGTVDGGAGHELALELEAVARAHVLEGHEEFLVALVGLVTKLVAGDTNHG